MSNQQRVMTAGLLGFLALLFLSVKEVSPFVARGPSEFQVGGVLTSSLEWKGEKRTQKEAWALPQKPPEEGEPSNLEKRLSELLGETPPAEEQPEPVFSSPQRQLAQLNPEISVLGDFWTIYTNEESIIHEHAGETENETDHEHGHTHEIKDGFRLKEVEIAFQAPLDPFSQAKFFVGIHEDEIHAEEAYVEWTNLPARLQLKLGKFFTNFGVINRWHPHAYPTADTPPALENIFGQEPFAGIGASLTWLMPPLSAKYNELNIEVVNGDNERAFSGEGFRHPACILHFKNYYDLSKATYLEIGLSGALGENDPDGDFMTYMEGLDISMVWSPPGREKYRGVEARGELFFTQRDTPEGTRSAFNMLSFVEAKLGRRWTGGVRLDYLEDPVEEAPSSYGMAPFLSFWQSEFVRIRFQYSGLNLHREKWRHRGIAQVTFALGPHKHEKY